MDGFGHVAGSLGANLTLLLLLLLLLPPLPLLLLLLPLSLLLLLINEPLPGRRGAEVDGPGHIGGSLGVLAARVQEEHLGA